MFGTHHQDLRQPERPVCNEVIHRLHLHREECHHLLLLRYLRIQDQDERSPLQQGMEVSRRNNIVVEVECLHVHYRPMQLLRHRQYRQCPTGSRKEILFTLFRVGRPPMRRKIFRWHITNNSNDGSHEVRTFPRVTYSRHLGGFSNFLLPLPSMFSLSILTRYHSQNMSFWATRRHLSYSLILPLFICVSSFTLSSQSAALHPYSVIISIWLQCGQLMLSLLYSRLGAFLVPFAHTRTLFSVATCTFGCSSILPTFDAHPFNSIHISFTHSYSTYIGHYNFHLGT